MAERILRGRACTGRKLSLEFTYRFAETSPVQGREQYISELRRQIKEARWLKLKLEETLAQLEDLLEKTNANAPKKVGPRKGN